MRATGSFACIGANEVDPIQHISEKSKVTELSRSEILRVITPLRCVCAPKGFFLQTVVDA